ncbi:MAG TPA: serine hydrolase [Ensifer sp.]|nr:serine hydrolase [Ensifer sp.]
MRIVFKLVKWLFGALVAAVVVFLVAIRVAPPELLQVGDSYAAKIACSNVFLAGRDPQKVLADDVQAPGNPILKAVMLDVDKEKGKVTARLLGYAAPRSSVYRPGYGCTNMADEAIAPTALPAPPQPTSPDANAEWPVGNHAGANFDPALSGILADDTLRGPGMRAIVVVHHGRIVAESYGPGFDDKTPLIGWSMTKTVNAILTGRAALMGLLSVDDKNLFPEWAKDERKEISLKSIAGMESGLAFNEDYGDVSDVTRMLYLQPDMAKFTISQPLVAKPDSQFNYSTGASVVMARYWMNKMPDKATALAFPHKELFNPLGMQSAVLELDQTDTFAAGSYLYASARDWARIGQFLLQDGVWDGTRLVSEDFMKMMRTANSTSNGVYTQMQTWLTGPGEEPNASFGAPADTFWLQGHDGQTVAIVPSRDLVVVRMGLTPSRLGYRPQTLLAAIAGKLKN